MRLKPEAEFLDVHSGQPIIPEYATLSAMAETHRRMGEYYFEKAARLAYESEQRRSPVLKADADHSYNKACLHFIEADQGFEESDQCRELVSDIDFLIKEKGRHDGN